MKLLVGKILYIYQDIQMRFCYEMKCKYNKLQYWIEKYMSTMKQLKSRNFLIVKLPATFGFWNITLKIEEQQYEKQYNVEVKPFNLDGEGQLFFFFFSRRGVRGGGDYG